MQSNTLQLKHVLPVVLCKVTGTFHCFFTALKMTEVVGRQVRLTRVYLNRERKFYDLTSLAFCFSLFFANILTWSQPSNLPDLNYASIGHKLVNKGKVRYPPLHTYTKTL